MWKPTISSDEIYHSCLAHSAKGSTWKNHKYIKKIGDAYIYAKAAKKAKKKAKEADERFDYEMNGAGHNASVAANEERNRLGKNVKPKSLDVIRQYPNAGHGVLDYGGNYKSDMDIAQMHLRRAGRARQEREMYERSARSYDDLSKKQLKDLKDEIGSDIKSIFKKKKKSRTKEYITDNKTGKKRSVDRSGKTINIKKLSEKNKKKK